MLGRMDECLCQEKCPSPVLMEHLSSNQMTILLGHLSLHQRLLKPIQVCHLIQDLQAVVVLLQGGLSDWMACEDSKFQFDNRYHCNSTVFHYCVQFFASPIQNKSIRETTFLLAVHWMCHRPR